MMLAVYTSVYIQQQVFSGTYSSVLFPSCFVFLFFLSIRLVFSLILYIYTTVQYVYVLWFVTNILLHIFNNTKIEVFILPPNVKRSVGRPKKIRILSKMEFKRCVKCGRCRRVGHNRKRCKFFLLNYYWTFCILFQNFISNIHIPVFSSIILFPYFFINFQHTNQSSSIYYI